MKNLKTITVLITIVLTSINVRSQEKKIDYNQGMDPVLKTVRLQTAKLQNQTTKYLVYVVLPNGAMGDISIWERSVELTDEEIIIKQSWKNQDKSKTREIFSINDRKTFLPKYHKAVSGKGVIEAYDFYEDKIVGSDSIANNTKKDFNLVLDKKGIPLNWELDLELFQKLPYQINRTFSLYFYHPGGKTPPKDYDYRVIREEQLSTSYGKIDSWVLQIIYDEEKGSKATFWIRKKDNMMVKMLEQYGPIKRIKQLL
ncbi:MAG: hypothetical protein KDC81_00410 [Flavobacteriaceae bacterium]|nr:hypothetical protein [Flavobacteriaceae bacterium]